MTFQPSVDSSGIRRLGFKCSWWHWRQAKDTVATERSIFIENHDLKVFPCCNEHVHVCTCTYTFLGLDACGGRKLRTDIHTYTHRTTTVTLVARLGLKIYVIMKKNH